MGLQAPETTRLPVALAFVDLRHLASVPSTRRRWLLVPPGALLLAAAVMVLLQRHAAPAALASRAERSAAATTSAFLAASARHDEAGANDLLCREFRNNPPAAGEVALVPGAPMTGYDLVAAHVYSGHSGGARGDRSAWVKERVTFADGTTALRTYQLVIDDASWRVCGLR